MSTKISQLTSATDVTANDLIQIVDVEDGVMAPSGTNKKATASLLAKELAKQPLEPGVVISGSSSSDAVRITQTGAGNALVVEDSTNPDSTPLVINNSGILTSGNLTPASVYNIFTTGQLVPKIQIQGFSTDASSFGVFQSQDNVASGLMSFAKSRGSVTSPTAAQVGDLLGVSSFQGYDGAGYQEGARLSVVIDQPVATGDVSAAFAFLTNPAGGGNNTTERMRIDSAGNVGIGTSSPAYQLQLSTDSAAKPSTSTWTVSSDERLKENIEAADLDICYNAVKNIPLKRYTWKDEIYSAEQVTDRSKIGWIAQDVQAVFPKAVGQHKFVYNQVKDNDGNIVSEDSIDDCLSLNSDQLYAALFGAVQKLMGKVESLQDRIAELESVS